MTYEENFSVGWHAERYNAEFMQTLPTSMKQHIILQANQSLTNLASQADKLRYLPYDNEFHHIEPTTAVNKDII